VKAKPPAELMTSIRDTLEALDVPWSEAVAARTQTLQGTQVCQQVSEWFTDAAARSCWIEWNPAQRTRIEDPNFLAHFRRFLMDGLELGYRLRRFRETSARLPDPDVGARNWIPFFEQCLVGEDCCTIRIFLSREQRRKLMSASAQSSGASWDGMLELMAEGLFRELGLVLRPITVSVDDSLASPWFRCEWNDLRLPPQRGLDPGHLLVNDTVDRLSLLQIHEAHEAINPANGVKCATIDAAHGEQAVKAGLTTWTPEFYAVLAIASMLRGAAGSLVNRSLYQLCLLRLREGSPDLVGAVEEVLDPDFVLQILRGLLAEEMSIRNLATILEGALELRASIDVDMNRYITFPPPTGGVFTGSHCRSLSALVPGDYVEFCRWRLRRYISHKYTRGGNTLVVYLLDRRAEDVLRSGDIDAGAQAAIIRAVREEVGALPPLAQTPVILTSMEARKSLRRLVSSEFPHLAVLSYQELSPDLNIQPIARISADF
jgi:type III secretion protein V